MGSRQGNFRSSIYKGKDGSWHGRVTVGTKDDGSPDRRHVRGTTKGRVAEKVRALEKARDAGLMHKAGETWTVQEWLSHWLEHIAKPYVKVNTYAGYRVAVNHHLIPGIGKHRLDKLRPEHLERLYLRILAKRTKRGTPTKPATAHQVHRTVRAALNEAVRRGHLVRNPALHARTPRGDAHEVEPYSVEEIQRLFRAASKRRNSARWVIALALGLRQGEVLGLKWSDVDFEHQTLITRRGRLRPKYEHGCGGDCGRIHAGHCPERIQIRSETDSTKSGAGRRVVGLPDALVELLKEHQVKQDEERARAGQLWNEGEWLFATETGEAMNPWTDWSHWKRLLSDAEIRDGRLHDARHTAATVLLLLGVNERTIMGVMGWSNPAMTARYAHMIDPIRKNIADRLGNLLWEQEDP